MRTSQKLNEAVVAVFGDLGRSPRMLNHARELLKKGFYVHIIGYHGEIDVDLRTSQRTKLHCISSLNMSWIYKNHPTLQFVLRFPLAVIRAFLLCFSLIFIFVKLMVTCHRAPKLMIIQTPPILPLFLVAPIYCLVGGTQLVVDWHNLGYTLVDGTSGGKILRSLYCILEIGLGRAIALVPNWRFICVSQALKNWLLSNLHVPKDKVSVVYDRPSDKFRILPGSERKKIREEFFNRFNISNRNSLMFVSSTSWTPDEDFSILFHAVTESDRILQESNSLNIQKIILFITGKGPLREQFELRIQQLRLRYFEILTVWLEPEAYPKLLSCADLGISLHTSSSGFDLPMKIVDMLGSGMPVCAYYYQCLSELMGKGKYGFVFRDSHELAEIMANISMNRNHNDIESIRSNIKQSPLSSWNKEWSKWYGSQMDK